MSYIMVILEFSVETDPRPKKRPKVYRWSTVNPSEKDENTLAELIRQHPNCPEKPYTGQIRVQLKFYKNPPKSTPNWQLEYMDLGYIRPNKSPDLDNYVKLVLDALNGILWEDDRYIIEMHSGKFYTTSEPKIEIVMEHVEQPQYMNEAESIITGYNQHKDLDLFFEFKEKRDDE